MYSTSSLSNFSKSVYDTFNNQHKHTWWNTWRNILGEGGRGLWLWRYKASSCLKSSHSTAEKCCPNTTRWEHLVLTHGTEAGARGGDFLGLLKDKINNVFAINQDHSPFHFNFYFRQQSTNSTGALLNPRVSILPPSSPSPSSSASPSTSSLRFLDGRVWAWWPGEVFYSLLCLVFGAAWPSSPSLWWLELNWRLCCMAELVCDNCHWIEQTVNNNYEIFPENILLLPARLVSHHNL